MPKRPELSGRLAAGEGKGRGAFAPGAAVAPTTREEGKGRWEDTHQRVTFHCSVVLRQAIEEEMQRSGRSKSRVIVDALRADLKVEEE